MILSLILLLSPGCVALVAMAIRADHMHWKRQQEEAAAAAAAQVEADAAQELEYVQE